MEAQAKGFPTEPVMNKTMEGMAEGASEEKIVQAGQQVRERHAFSNRHAARQSVRNSIADCRTAGLRDEHINGIMTQLQQQAREMSHNQSEEFALATLQTTRTIAAASRAGNV